ncbi:restriction endonuclease subunit S [Thermodesulfovibrio thiophilus]|uniref:restriction endonuclease subunit S n=1 Tax=Thermodesulfovibrio thiophilus TaxID=340095 RepID=UPI00184D3CEE|nr:restriction endonuclease subunit S [Thermodesulfovibrio thiophilus]HHW19607.1 hypothetical protein [Thermodesulfovibrio thiophilus]
MNTPTNDIIPQGYKMTELGVLPEEWKVVRINDLCDITTGKKDVNEGNPKGIYPFFTCAEKITYSDSYSFDTEAILVSGNGDVGLTKYYKGKFEVYQRTYVFYNFKTNPKFLFYYFLSGLKKKLIKNKSGSTMPYIRKGDLLSFLIPLPPLPEQQKIAAVLSAVQEAKEKTEAVIDAAKALKKSMMKHLFTYGPVSPQDAENVPLKETEIGPVPEDWEVVRLGDLSKKNLMNIQFGFPSGKWNDKKIGIAQLRPFNITENGETDLSVLKYIESDKDISKYLIQKEDIIFNNTNSEELVGKTAYWKYENDKYVLSNHMTIIRIVDKNIMNAYFLAKYLHKKWSDGFYRTVCRRHVNQSSISLARLNEIKIPLPPLSIQQKIASILSAIDEKIEAEENKKKALEELFKSLLHNLMTAKIRVNQLEISS